MKKELKEIEKTISSLELNSRIIEYILKNAS